MEGDPGPEGGVADGRGAGPGHQQATVVAVGHRGAAGGQQRRQPGGLGGPHQHGGLGVGGDEVGHRGVGDEGAPPDDHQVGRRQRHLTHQMAGDEDGPTFGSQRLEQIADPEDPLGIQAVDGLVEEQDPGVAQEGRGNAQPLAHPEGELSHPAPGHRGEADLLQHLLDAVGGNAIALGQAQQVESGGAARVDRLRLQQGTDLSQWPGQVVVAASADRDRDRRRAGRGPGSSAWWSTYPTRWGRGSPVTRPGPHLERLSSSTARVRP